MYPHQDYNAVDGAWLRYTQCQLVQALDVPVLDFLSAVNVWELLAAPVKPLSFDEVEFLPVDMVAEVAAVRRSSSSSSTSSSCSFVGAGTGAGAGAWGGAWAGAGAGAGAGAWAGARSGGGKEAVRTAATAALPVIPSGLWPVGSYSDPGHPNDTGYVLTSPCRRAAP